MKITDEQIKAIVCGEVESPYGPIDVWNRRKRSGRIFLSWTYGDWNAVCQFLRINGSDANFKAVSDAVRKYVRDNNLYKEGYREKVVEGPVK